jgi:hypothetical protein
MIAIREHLLTPFLRHLSLSTRQQCVSRELRRRHGAQVANTFRGVLREDVQHLLARNGDSDRLIYSSGGAGGRQAFVMKKSAAFSLVRAKVSHFAAKGFSENCENFVFSTQKNDSFRVSRVGTVNCANNNILPTR